MKTLLIFFAILPCFAAVPAGVQTTGLAEFYTMGSSGVSGSTLTDQTANGNNGTITGTSQSALATTFNGTSDFISIPKVVGNSDFTVIVIAKPTAGSNGYTWWEGADNGANESYLTTAQNGSFAGTPFTNSVPLTLKDWHAFYLQRSATAGYEGILDLNYRRTVTISGSSTATRGGLGCRKLLAGCQQFWAGQMAYVAVYTIPLTQTQIQNVYAALQAALAVNSGFIPNLTLNPPYPTKVWNRQGSVIIATTSPNDGGGAEPSALYTTTDCKLISNPCVQLYYTGTGGIWYAEAPSPEGPFTKSAAVVLTGHDESAVINVAGVYYIYAENTTTHNIDLYTSPANTPNSFSLDTAAVITKGAGGTWESTAVYNNWVVRVDATHWYMVYEAQGALATSFACGVATSTDGRTWTKGTANPITGFTFVCGNPWFTITADGVWHLWAGNGGTGANMNGFSRWSATTFNSAWQASTPSSNWNVNPGTLPMFRNDAPDESTYIADPTYIELNGKTYMYYNSYDGSSNHIKLAIANMPISQLVLTGEGAFTSVP